MRRSPAENLKRGVMRGVAGGRPLAAIVAWGLVCVLGQGAAAEQSAAPQVAASPAEKEELMLARGPQSEAVVTLNEAIMTAQAARRAQTYLDRLRDRASVPARFVPADVKAMDAKLQDIQERFFTLYQAHFGRTKDRKRNPVELSPDAKRLAHDAVARTAERQRFVQHCLAVRDEAKRLLAQVRASLAELQKEAAHLPGVPPFKSAPRFVEKPPATLRPDGTPTGIVFGIALAGLPGTLPRGLDYEAGCYERYDTDFKVSPIAAAASRGRSTQVIVPCAVHDKMYCPVKWYLQHRDKDICRPGTPEEYKGQWLWTLDFNHPAVREMFGQYLKSVGERYKENRNVIMLTTAWEPELNDSHRGAWGQWPTGGRGAASVRAFREYLKGKFATIEKLNKAWHSSYERFDAIEPPPDLVIGPEPERSQLIKRLSSGACPPLYYEFNRFLKDSYADYLAWCYRKLKAADPNHPIAVSPSYGSVDGFLCTGRDSFRWAAEACDLYGSENHSSLEEVFNWSIHRALNRTTGILEFVWNGPENWSDPPEEVARAAARRNLWRLVAWGRAVIALFGAGDTYGGASHNNMLVFDSGYNLLRRSAGIVGPLKLKLRSMEDVWLGSPVGEPKIAMLKPSTSQICAWPSQAVEKTAESLHNILHKRNYHYAFVPEEYVLSGKDDLDRYRVLILPYATHFPPGLSQKILAWVKSGGTLIIVGIAGGFTPYGARDGELMKEIFGQLGYMPWGERLWKMDVRPRRPEARMVGRNYAETFVADYGKGRVLMAVRANDVRPGGPGARLCRELIDRAAPREAWATGSELEMVLRRDGTGVYVILINPSPRTAAEARIHLAAHYRLAVDRGIEGGFVVPLRVEGGHQVFDISLAPGEGTLIQLTP